MTSTAVTDSRIARDAGIGLSRRSANCRTGSHQQSGPVHHKPASQRVLPIFLFFAVSVWSASAPGEVNQELRALLQSEGLPAWENYEQNLADIDIVVRRLCVQQKGPNGRSEQTADLQYHIFWDAPRRMQILDIRHLDQDPVVWNRRSSNPSYQFMLAWPKGEDGDNQIMSTALNLPEDTQSWTKEPLLREARFTVINPVAVIGLPLRELLSDPAFEIRTLEEAGTGIRLEAVYSGQPGRYRYFGGKYWCVIECEQDWTVSQAGIETQDFKQRIDIQTTVDPEFGRIPQLATLRWEWTSSPIQQSHTFEYQTPTRCELADEEFYLPYYGHSEAVLDSLTPRRWSRWLLVAAGVVSLFVAARLVFQTEEQTQAPHQEQTQVQAEGQTGVQVEQPIHMQLSEPSQEVKEPVSS